MRKSGCCAQAESEPQSQAPTGVQNTPFRGDDSHTAARRRAADSRPLSSEATFKNITKATLPSCTDAAWH